MMEQVKQDISKALNLMKPKKVFSNKDNTFSKLYPFSNENVKGMFDNFDFTDKECFSVLASSDQVFDMYLRGAKKVSTFDGNSLTKYLFSLKKASLLANLSRDEYLNYFCYNYAPYVSSNYNAFSEEYFNKMVPYLDSKSLKFWGDLYDKKLDIRKSGRLFSSDELFRFSLKQTIKYLDDDNFELLKEMAPDITIDFINQDIRYLHLEEIYDFMYFSNIIQYAENIFFQEKYMKLERKQLNSLKSYRDLIMSFKNNLSHNGQIIVGYIYTIFDDYNRNAIFNKNVRDQVFSSENFSYHYFDSIVSINDFDSDKYVPFPYKQDACLVYTKK